MAAFSEARDSSPSTTLASSSTRPNGSTEAFVGTPGQPTSGCRPPVPAASSSARPRPSAETAAARHPR